MIITDRTLEPASGYLTYQQRRIQHWDAIGQGLAGWQGLGGRYHHRLTDIYRSLIMPGASVLELGCFTGDLLASLQPGRGVGVDFSAIVLDDARRRHPELEFIQADVHELNLEDEIFDFIILSDLVNELWDVQTVLEKLRPYCGPQTRLVINTYSRLWELPLTLAKKMHLARPVLSQNWLTVPDLKSILSLSGFETFRSWPEVLCPLSIPIIEPLCNRVLVRFWPLRELALTNILIARPVPQPPDPNERPSLSIVIPARNEAGNIPRIFESIPDFEARYELIFVEGHSKDDTAQMIRKAIADHPELDCHFIHQTGIGKGNAVREGFAIAQGDILAILDADLTVPFDYLPRFYRAIYQGTGDFINGVRLIYPQEQESMRFFNLIGNKTFSLIISWILDQPIKDTLCGTKVLRRSDYERIAQGRVYFGDFDPFGDFDLLFGAARLNLKIVDLPVRYRGRIYGQTNIQRWKHGWLLLKMTVFALVKLKFQ